jgi:hypothetical protein
MLNLGIGILLVTTGVFLGSFITCLLLEYSGKSKSMPLISKDNRSNLQKCDCEFVSYDQLKSMISDSMDDNHIKIPMCLN